jgi:hypothetical protein
MFGDQVSSVALPLTAVLVLHADAAAMGYLTALQWLPSLLSGLHKRLTARLGAGLVYVAGCLVFTGPLALVPLAGGAHGGTVLVMLFAAEFLSGFGVMVLDISIAAIFAVVIPDTMRSRVSGAFPGDQLRQPAGGRAAWRPARRRGRTAGRALDRGGGRDGGRAAAASFAVAAVPAAAVTVPGPRWRLPL